MLNIVYKYCVILTTIAREVPEVVRLIEVSLSKFTTTLFP